MMEDFGIVSVVAITAICYIVGIGIKAWGKIDKYIPCMMGILGMILGAVGLYVMPDFPANDIITALGIGAVSGLSATGINQLGRQLQKEE